LVTFHTILFKNKLINFNFYYLMFWGVILKDNKPHEIKMNKLGILHLSEACLGSRSDGAKIHLQLQAGNQVYNLCVLQKDKWETYKLDHYITVEDNEKKYKLIAYGNNGNNEIHVTGFVETEDDDDFEDEREVKKTASHTMSKDSDEEEEVEESSEKPIVKKQNEKQLARKGNPGTEEEKKPQDKQKVQPIKSVEKKPQDKQIVQPNKPVENKPKPIVNRQTVQLTPKDDEDDDDVSVEIDSNLSDAGEDNDDDMKLLKDDDNDSEEIEQLLSKHRATQELEGKQAKKEKLDDQSKASVQKGNQNKGNQQQNKGPQKGNQQMNKKGNSNQNKGQKINQTNKPTHANK
jgi:hypothetical protein